jgi:hypothetical protein
MCAGTLVGEEIISIPTKGPVVKHDPVVIANLQPILVLQRSTCLPSTQLYWY